MTHRDLLDQLRRLPEEQLDTDLTIYIPSEDEYYPAKLVLDHDSEGVLDEGHPVFKVRE